MPTPSLISDLSQTAAANFPSGGDTPSVLDDVQRAHASFIAQLRDGKGFTNPVVLASATTTDIGGQNSMFVDVSGTTTITSFGTAYNGPRFLRFTGVLTLTHNATVLSLPGGSNITTAAGDTCLAVPNVALNGWNVVSYESVSSVQNSATQILSSVTGTNTITGNLSPALTAYVNGQTFRFISAGANTGAVTLNINGLGAKAVTKSGSIPLVTGDIAAGAAIQVVYDAAGNQFQLTSGAGGGGATGSGGDQVFYENDTVVSNDHTITRNSSMVGPLEVATGKNLTIATGKRLVIL